MPALTLLRFFGRKLRKDHLELFLFDEVINYFFNALTTHTIDEKHITCPKVRPRTAFTSSFVLSHQSCNILVGEERSDPTTAILPCDNHISVVVFWRPFSGCSEMVGASL